jgi:diguanylate cyclase (GGDEF)-like protein
VTGPIDRLARANELASVVLLRARADALLEHAATHDRLTQLPNREGFHRRATEVLTNTDSETAAISFIDLDGFKPVNDEYGHAAGDLVLATAAKRLQSVTRRVDLLARMGGDEFVILVGASADRPVNAARVQVIADRALQELRREIDIGSSTVTISASIGGVIATAPATLEDLLAKADAAMYEAKRNHGDQHHIVSLG